MIKRIFLLALILVPVMLISTSKASAVTAGEFQAGRIIDDGVFFNGQSMSPSEVQSFLNAKVPSCDTNGSQPYGNSTRAAYANSKGYSAPFTCLKDYRQDTPTKGGETGLCDTFYGGNRSAAEIIYEVGRVCGVSPRALIVLLEKEQSLITDTWPWSIQYRSATGYGCPDTAPCDAEYYGFFNQVYNSARQFKRYAKDSSLFRYRAFRDNYIQYNPNAACGGTNVYIQNQATAGLYNFTPYQPNASALNNLYGSGDGCGAYGNRNFWRIYSDWFGSTYSNEHLWRVIRTPNDGRLFLQVGNTKRWIPTGGIYSDWSLDKYTVNPITEAEFNSIPTIPELTRVGNDGNYNYVVDAGRKHYLPRTHEALWNYPNTIAAPVSSLLRTLPETEPLGRFIKDSTGNMYVMDNGAKRPITPSDAAAWGASSGNTVGIGSEYLSAMPVGSTVSRHVSSAGTTYIVDQGLLLRMYDPLISNTWATTSYVNVGGQALSFMPNRNASYLVRASNSPHWFMLDAGKRYYVANGNTAVNWSLDTNSLLTISPELMSQFSYGIALTNFTRDASNGSIYVLDGKRHYIPSNSLFNSIVPSPSQVIDVSSARINSIPNGEQYNKPFIVMNGSPHIFMFDKGKRYHVWSGDLYNAYNRWGNPLALSASLIEDSAAHPETLQSVVKDSSDNYFLIDGGKKTPIDPSMVDVWKTSVTPTLSDELMDGFTTNPDPITTQLIQNNGNTFIVDQGSKKAIHNSMISSYTGSSRLISMTNNTIATAPGFAGYIVKSREDGKSWWINQGTRTEVDFARQLTLGVLTTPLKPESLSNTFLATIPVSSNNSSLLIKKQSGGGVKFLNFGYALGFPDSQTLANAVGSGNNILTVDDYTYDNFPLRGSLSRVLKDDSGKLYLYEAGKRRWMTNYNAYKPYENIPVTYLYGTTMSLISEGPAIN